MKLKNKKTGEILEMARSSSVINDKFRIYDDYNNKFYTYSSLAELNEEWQDYEEPKGIQDIYVPPLTPTACVIDFNTKEEAEKAVERLRAWKRLKNYNLKFNLDFVKNKIDFTYSINNPLLDVLDGEEQIFNNMKIVFGGEE